MMPRPRYKTDRPGEVRPLNKWEKLAIATGYDPLGMFNPPLTEDPDERWRGLWKRHADEILAEETTANPGERPAAWWRWSAPGEPGTDESVPEYLDRCGLIAADELRAMWSKLIERLRHNRVRRPVRSAAGFFVEHFLPFTAADRFALAHPIEGLNPEEQRLVDELDPRLLEIRADEDDDEPTD
jgi:hypothetical protein